MDSGQPAVVMVADAAEAPAPPAPGAGPTPAPASASAAVPASATATATATVSTTATVPATVSATPAASPTPAVVDVVPTPQSNHRPLELGATTFLLAGIGTAGVLGVSAFVADPLSADVILRIALAGGKAFQDTLPTTWVGGRVDTCYVASGNYAAGQGLSFGVCGGADIGLTLYGAVAGQQAQTLPFVAIGPSVEVGAELGETATLLLRAGVGLSLARDTFVDGDGDRIDPSPGTERAELGLSWKLP